MKNWIKIIAALVLASVMTLSIAAGEVVELRVMDKSQVGLANPVINTIRVILPTVRGMERVTVKSSIATDDISTVNLFDHYSRTAVVLPANKEGGAFVSTAPANGAYKLGAVAVGTKAEGYTFKVYGSNDPDQIEWVEIPMTLDEAKSASANGNYHIWMASVPKTEYFYYRFVFTADTELELTGLELYEKIPVSATRYGALARVPFFQMMRNS